MPGQPSPARLSFLPEAAERNTRDVDILIRRGDLPALEAAMLSAGFHHRATAGMQMFVEPPAGSARDAVHVVICGAWVRPGEHEPNPDIEPVVKTGGFRTVPLETLVRMKLNSFRDKDRVHLRDMISLGMVDSTWIGRLPEPFRDRLAALLADPDG